MAKISSAREDMLSAATELFRARGYEGVGVAELLEKAGAPRGSLYFHFPGGKEQIGAEVVERVGRNVAVRFRQLHESGVDLDSFIERIFKTTAKESRDRSYKATCPMAVIAAEIDADNPKLAAAVRNVFVSWETEIAEAARARGMNAKDAGVFASALISAMEGAFIVSKAQGSSTAHVNASRAIRALAAAMMAS
jgi:TetR/AcrR family transcriptional repressor of lmrAB and yxaGH operons